MEDCGDSLLELDNIYRRDLKYGRKQ